MHKRLARPSAIYNIHEISNFSACEPSYILPKSPPGTGPLRCARSHVLYHLALYKVNWPCLSGARVRPPHLCETNGGGSGARWGLVASVPFSLRDGI